MEPLEGIRVVEVAVAVQGPGAGGFLAELGADVVKVEPPWGDGNRYYRGVGNDLPEASLGTQFVSVSSGKRSVALDVHSELGREAVYKLIERADIFLSNYRPAALERMGLSYEALAARNDRIIYSTANGFGPEGPDAQKAMTDQYAQARSGIASVTGVPGSPAIIPGAIIADTAGAIQLVVGILAALAARELHGISQQVSSSAYGAMLWAQSWEIDHSSLTGEELHPLGPFHPMTTDLAGIYETADDVAYCIGVRGSDGWNVICEFAGLPQLIDDPRWDVVSGRVPSNTATLTENARALRPELAAAVRAQTSAAWESFFEQNPDSILAQRVFDYSDVLDDPQALENGYIVEKDIPHVGRRKVVGNPLSFSKTPASAKNSFPELGQHTEEVLTEVGFSATDITSLKAQTIAAAENRLSR